MFKRARWIGAGAALGAGGALWARSKLKALTSRYSPGGVTGGAVLRARSIPGDVRGALAEGRTAMREREAELRRQHLRPGNRSPHR